MFAAVTLDAEVGIQGVAFWNSDFSVVGFEMGVGVGYGANLSGGYEYTRLHTLGGIPAMIARSLFGALPNLNWTKLLQQAESRVRCL